MKNMFVTPEMAIGWLNNQAINRKVSDVAVNRYIAAMEAETWIASERMPLSFLPDGRLADGQHRLEAVVRRDRGQNFYVTTIDQTELDLIHECRARSLSDRLTISGMFDKSVSNLATSIGSALAQRQQQGELQVSQKRHTLTMYGRRPDEIIEAWDWSGADTKSICDLAKSIYDMQLSNSRLVTPTMVGYLLAQRAAGTKEFLTQLCMDSHPDRCTSAITLRRQLSNKNHLASMRLGLVAAAFNNRESKVLRVFDVVPDLRGGTFAGR
jgi:hypothetical protein